MPVDVLGLWMPFGAFGDEVNGLEKPLGRDMDVGTVDGRKPHQLIESVSHYLRGFIHPRWCRIMISSIKGISEFLR